MRLRQASLTVSEELVSGFVAMLANNNLSYASIRIYLSAICHLQISNGLLDASLRVCNKGDWNDLEHTNEARIVSL